MRSSLKHTVRTAVEVGLLDPDVVGAIYGNKVAASAAGDQTYSAAGLERQTGTIRIIVRYGKAKQGWWLPMNFGILTAVPWFICNCLAEGPPVTVTATRARAGAVSF